MTSKPQPNHNLYLAVLRSMTPEQRLQKAFDLSRLGRELFRRGLERRHPELSPEELETLLRERLNRCHNRNY